MTDASRTCRLLACSQPLIEPTRTGDCPLLVRTSDVFVKVLLLRRLLPVIILLAGMSVYAVAAEFGSQDLYFAQAVIDAGSTTTFSIHNPATVGEVAVRADFYSFDGSLLKVEFLSVAPLGTGSVTFGSGDGTLSRGWVRLSADADFIATEFVDLFVGKPLPRIGVLPSAQVADARVSGFINSDYRSGLAIANPDLTDSIEVTAVLLDPEGHTVGDPAHLVIGPLKQVAAFLNEDSLFGSDLTDFAGSVSLSTSSGEVVLVSLVQEVHTGNVSTVAAFGPKAAVSSAISGYEQVVETYELVNEPRFAIRSFSVNCPAGKSVLGGGAGFSNSFSHELTLAKSYPLFSQGWSAEFQVPAENSSGTINATIQVWAMCAPVAP